MLIFRRVLLAVKGALVARAVLRSVLARYDPQVALEVDGAHPGASPPPGMGQGADRVVADAGKAGFTVPLAPPAAALDPGLGGTGHARRQTRARWPS
jgi:hypothetical protein